MRRRRIVANSANRTKVVLREPKLPCRIQPGLDLNRLWTMTRHGLVNSKRLTFLTAILCTVSPLLPAKASAEQGQFSLSSGFLSPEEYSTARTTGMISTPSISRYETGPWAFKLTGPSGVGGSFAGIGHILADIPDKAIPSGFTESEAAATYSLGAGATPTFGINLTGKLKLGLDNANLGLAPVLNGYAAQAEAFEKFANFRALGSFGYKIHEDAAGLGVDHVIYGSIGGDYQLNEKLSGGVDFRLSQNPTPLVPGQRQLSAYVNHNINDTVRARAYLLDNLSNGSPDYSIGAAVSYGF
jgi:hypothetical protein